MALIECSCKSVYVTIRDELNEGPQVVIPVATCGDCGHMWEINPHLASLYDSADFAIIADADRYGYEIGQMARASIRLSQTERCRYPGPVCPEPYQIRPGFPQGS